LLRKVFEYPMGASQAPPATDDSGDNQ
jgi:hypothetical protein